MQLINKKNKERQKDLKERTDELRSKQLNNLTSAQAKQEQNVKDFKDKLKSEAKRKKEKEQARE